MGRQHFRNSSGNTWKTWETACPEELLTTTVTLEHAEVLHFGFSYKWCPFALLHYVYCGRSLSKRHNITQKEKKHTFYFPYCFMLNTSSYSSISLKPHQVYQNMLSDNGADAPQLAGRSRVDVWHLEVYHRYSLAHFFTQLWLWSFNFLPVCSVPFCGALVQNEAAETRTNPRRCTAVVQVCKAQSRFICIQLWIYIYTKIASFIWFYSLIYFRVHLTEISVWSVATFCL